MKATVEPAQGHSDYWSVPEEDLLRRLRSTPQGVSAEEARRRLAGGPTRLIQSGRWTRAPLLLLAQFKSPIILILIVAAVLSLFLGDATDAVIILAIVLASGLLGFWQERGAADAVAKLLDLVQTRASVLRDGGPSRSRSSRSCRATSCSSAPATSSPATAGCSTRRTCSSTRRR